MSTASIQAAIEKEAGITVPIAQYIMTANTTQAKNAMGLLRMAVDHYDEPTMALLSEAVKDCAKDLEVQQKKVGSTEWAISQIMGSDS